MVGMNSKGYQKMDKLSIRKKVFRPKKHPKVPKMTLPNFRTKKKALEISTCCLRGGPYDGQRIIVTEYCFNTLPIRVGDYWGIYKGKEKSSCLYWESFL